VGQNVTGAQERGYLVDRRWAVPDVHHDRKSELVSELSSQLERSDPDTARGIGIDARLDAEDDVAVRLDHRGSELEVAIVEIGELPRWGDQADRGEIQKCKNPNPARLDDVPAKTRKRVGSGTSDIQPGRHSGPRSDRIGFDSPVGRTPVDVRMEVDETRRHDLTPRIDHLLGDGIRQRTRHAHDPSLADPDVETAEALVRRVDHLTAENERVEALPFRWPHRSILPLPARGSPGTLDRSILPEPDPFVNSAPPGRGHSPFHRASVERALRERGESRHRPTIAELTPSPHHEHR
jgi:hypothetical protein